MLSGIALNTGGISWVNAETSKVDECSIKRTGNIIYVDPSANGKGTGEDWSNAYKSLQEALDAASASTQPDQLWVAKGKYDAVSSGYKVPSNTQLYGGFAGNETSFKQRSFIRNATILRGRGVARHVFFVGDAVNVVLDGLTIKGGNATGNLNEDELDQSNEVRGGGILSLNSDLRVCNSTFRKNKAKKFGGAIYHQGGKLTVSRSKFSRNTVLRGEMEVHDTDMEADTDGGAIAVQLSESLNVTESVFKDNIAGDDAGAIAARKTDIHISKSRFLRNKGISLALQPTTGLVDELLTGMGGAVQVWNDYTGFLAGDQSYQTVILDSTFEQNQSAIASALYIQSTPGSITISKRNKFRNNGGDGKADLASIPREQGTRFGRGVGAFLIVGLRFGDRESDSEQNFVRPLHHATVTNTYFEGNKSGYGAALGLIGMDGEIENSFFVNNRARQRGGAIWSHNFLGLFDQFGGFIPDYGTLNIKSSLFYGNQALGQLETLQHDTFPAFISINEQSYGGGAIHNEIGNNLDIVGSWFIKNEAFGSDGGAINNVSASVEFFGSLPEGSASYGARLNINSSQFYGNKAAGSGGAISNGAAQINGGVTNINGEQVGSNIAISELLINDSYFINNNSNKFGGAVSNWNTSVLDVSSSLFKHNSSANGGAISSVGVDVEGAKLNVSTSVVIRNRARTGFGGGIYGVNSNGGIDSASVLRWNQPENVDWQ